MLLNLTIEQINSIIKGLTELPFKEAYQVIMAVQGQVNENIANEQKAAAELADKVKKDSEKPPTPDTSVDIDTTVSTVATAVENPAPTEILQ
jgi:hypothetical protein